MMDCHFPRVFGENLLTKIWMGLSKKCQEAVILRRFLPKNLLI